MATEYIVVTDEVFVVSGTIDPEPFPFTLPAQVIRSGNKRPILSFMLKPNPGVGNIRFDVEINAAPQLNVESIRANEKSVFWEIVNNNAVNAGPNTITFRMLSEQSPQGELRFSDVVIWFQTS